jgi:hypothetical protein
MKLKKVYVTNLVFSILLFSFCNTHSNYSDNNSPWFLKGARAQDGTHDSEYLKPSFKIVMDFYKLRNRLPNEFEFDSIAHGFFGLDYRWMEHAAPIRVHYTIIYHPVNCFKISIWESEGKVHFHKNGGHTTDNNYHYYYSDSFIDLKNGSFKGKFH